MALNHLNNCMADMHFYFLSLICNFLENREGSASPQEIVSNKNLV